MLRTWGIGIAIGLAATLGLQIGATLGLQIGKEIGESRVPKLKVEEIHSPSPMRLLTDPAMATFVIVSDRSLLCALAVGEEPDDGHARRIDLGGAFMIDARSLNVRCRAVEP